MDIDGMMRFSMEVKIPTNEIGTWPRDRIKALFNGMALIKGAVDGTTEGAESDLAIARRHEEELRAAIMMLPEPPAEMGDGPHERVAYALQRMGIRR